MSLIFPNIIPDFTQSLAVPDYSHTEFIFKSKFIYRLNEQTQPANALLNLEYKLRPYEGYLQQIDAFYNLNVHLPFSLPNSFLLVPNGISNDILQNWSTNVWVFEKPIETTWQMLTPNVTLLDFSIYLRSVIS